MSPRSGSFQQSGVEKALFSPTQPRRGGTRLSPGFVLASFLRTMNRETKAAELRLCPWNGVSLGEEAVLADLGRAGEVAARAGRVRIVVFLNTLRVVRSLTPKLFSDLSHDTVRSYGLLG